MTTRMLMMLTPTPTSPVRARSPCKPEITSSLSWPGDVSLFPIISNLHFPHCTKPSAHCQLPKRLSPQQHATFPASVMTSWSRPDSASSHKQIGLVTLRGQMRRPRACANDLISLLLRPSLTHRKRSYTTLVRMHNATYQESSSGCSR